MKKIVVGSLLALSTLLVVFAASRAAERSRRINLPTSKGLTLPVPGYLARTNSFPATIALSPDGRYAALLNQGYGTQETGARQSIAILDLRSNQLRDFPDDRLSDETATRQSYFIGLAFSSDGQHLYASMGSITDPEGKKPKSTGNGIAVYKFAAGQVTPERFIKIPPQRLVAGKKVSFGVRKTPAGTAPPYPAGFVVLSTPQGDRLLVANNLSDNVVLLDVNSGEIRSSFDLSRTRFVPSGFPYTVVANKAGTKAWCSLWNYSSVAELSLETGKVEIWHDLLGSPNSIAPGSHPTAMLLSPKEDILYVALSNANVVVAVDLKGGKTSRVYRTNLDDHGHAGSVPQAIALSSDGTRLYAATASLDAVAVFDTKTAAAEKDVRPIGFIPTEWYPSAIAIAGNDLLIATAKGQGSGPNNMMGKLKSERRHRDHPYIPTLIGGSIARLSLAEIEKNLAAYTKQVEEDNLLRADPGKFTFPDGKNPIRHVIYILKENRTYDQVLGDLPVGNGDSSLTLYGADITPNQHKLALQFGVLDNFYDSGEVSGDGHIWSNAATTSDYNEKNWPIGYRSKERTYDADGTMAEELPLEQGIPDIDDPATGFLWDNLAKRGLSYRIYGEFVQGVWCKDQKAKSPKEGTPSPTSAPCPSAEIRKGDPLPPNVGNPRGGPSPWPWPVPQLKRMRPTKAALRDHYNPRFPDFNTDYPDQLRADEFLREFDEFVAARGTAKELPQFILLYLPDDHTGGTRPGRPTPQASVADNDLALGRVVEAISHSAYWDDTAIFVIEDDAQDGADHVDAHRSTAFVISKYSPRTEKPFVDSNFYTTVSMVHTMEELLGLPPMNLFDAHAPLMTLLFSGPGTQPPYQADDKNLRSGLIYQINGKKAPGAKESSQMDFSRPDAANAAQLNGILWRNEKGEVPMPVSRHAHSAP
ncbi:MAG: beta-propeller fold lactonase family protein [Acidobacteriales bacterium]|nr:beta-propeller fold lactonase family protein [Candidatus Koribacter versatilis]MBI3645756.1 beta-propeller fold lactonase family protein [Terriglobales bacterium]